MSKNEEMMKFLELYLSLGFILMPVKKDKKPILNGWTHDDFKVPDDDLRSFAKRDTPIGIVTGKRSGITVVDIDFKSPGVFGTDPNIFPDTFTVRTPSGACQKYYQYDSRIHQSQKGFDLYPNVDIRNDGGQVVAPPSKMDYMKAYEGSDPIHITSAYEVMSGSLLNLTPFPYDLFKKYCEQEKEILISKKKEGVVRPGDDFESSATWEEILSPFGWTRMHTDRSGSTHWRRPGKDSESTGATTSVRNGTDRLFVFSTNAQPLAPYDKKLKNSYTKVSAYATLNHRGDFNAAVNDLKNQGYGIKKEKTEEEDTETSMIRMDSVEDKPIEWIWKGKIARSELCILAGEPGAGKTMIAVDIAARVSKGSALPLSTECIGNGKEASVIFLTSENDPAKVLKPRLVAAGADLSRIFLLESSVTKKENGKKIKRHIALAEDSEKIGAAIAQCGECSLLVIDPISEYMGKKDANSNSDVRDVLATLTDHVREKNTAILAVTHYNKKVEITSASARINGSIGFAGAARTAFAVGKFYDEEWSDEEKATRKGQMAFSMVKNNLSGDSGGFVYKILPMTYYNKDNELIETARVEWVETINESADELMVRLANKRVGRPAQERGKCEAWLESFLRKYPEGIPRSEVIEAGMREQFSASTIDRTVKDMFVTRNKGIWKIIFNNDDF